MIWPASGLTPCIYCPPTGSLNGGSNSHGVGDDQLAIFIRRLSPARASLVRLAGRRSRFVAPPAAGGRFEPAGGGAGRTRTRRPLLLVAPTITAAQDPVRLLANGRDRLTNLLFNKHSQRPNARPPFDARRLFIGTTLAQPNRRR